jgi:hypothetical protein
VPSGDGPSFFIALAEMPQLGVSLTVWGEVVADDLHLLDELARRVEAGELRPPVPLALSTIDGAHSRR